ncbi:hypothetical protein COCVIDRAFT_11469 [Bipolaris victoriae FI3]|uniref:C2H2-type domain-containing protein n=1 Tax=Bipolaris victoriae (strain FI3) TaxID=930091 RepID=W7EQF5_BIPV3|nr:hypothetical protein COCVIDRAFT_11469 [Bipolaris victoriae FI3]
MQAKLTLGNVYTNEEQPHATLRAMLSLLGNVPQSRRVLRCVLRYSIAMVPPVQQSPSDESNPSIQGDGDQSSQPISQFDLLNRLAQALSCLRAGIGVEVWSLEVIWPGVGEQLLSYDSEHPGTLSLAEFAAIWAMALDKNSRKFDCPVFVAEARHGWPRTCNNVKSANMSELRRHLRKRPGLGYTRQLAFLELCPTCNDDFIDKEEFESRHGYNGELCNNRQSQRRGANAQVQWQLLYRKVEAAMASQHLQVHASPLSNNYENGIENIIQEENNHGSPLPGANASIPTSLASYNDIIEFSTVKSGQRNEKETMPYSTPYELILDSDSDDRQSDTEPQRTASSVTSGINQNSTSDTRLASRYVPLHVYGRSGVKEKDTLQELGKVRDTPPSAPWMSQSIRHYRTSNTGKDIDNMEENFQSSPWSTITRLSTLGDGSEATWPTVSNTGPWQIDSFRKEYPPWSTQSIRSERPKETQPVDYRFRRRAGFTDFSTMDRDQRWGSVPASGDRSTSSHFRYTGPVESFDPGGNDRAKDSPRSPRHMSTVRRINHRDGWSSYSAPAILQAIRHCPHCDATFSDTLHGKGNLARHIRHKHRDRPQICCSYCGQLFQRSDARLKHHRKKHPDFPPP